MRLEHRGERPGLRGGGGGDAHDAAFERLGRKLEIGDVHAGQDRVLERDVGELRVLEVRAFQDRAGEVHAFQPRMAEGGALERGIGEIDAHGLFAVGGGARALIGDGRGAQIGAVELGESEPGAADRGAAHVGLDHPRRGEIAVAQIGAVQVGALQIGAEGGGADQRGEGEIGLGQIAVGEIETVELGARELRFGGALLVGQEPLMREQDGVQLLLAERLARLVVVVLEHRNATPRPCGLNRPVKVCGRVADKC